MKKKNKISFVFDIVLLIVAMICGFIMLLANMFNPFLHQYVFIGIIVLEALCVSMIISILILVRKAKKREREEYD